MRLYEATLYMLTYNKTYKLSRDGICSNDKEKFRPVQTMTVRKKLNGTVCEISSGITFPILKILNDEKKYVVTSEDRLLYASIDRKLSIEEMINLKRNLLQKELSEQTVESINDLLSFEKQMLEKDKIKIKNR